MSAPLNTGDIHDDDPDVIDSFTRQAPEPPAPPLEPITVPLIKERVPETRLLTGYMYMDPSWGVTRLVSTDLSRKHLRIRVEGTKTTDGIAISSDPAQLIIVDGICRAGMLYTDDRDDFDDHTGPVYILPVGQSATNPGQAEAPVKVSWWAVCR